MKKMKLVPKTFLYTFFMLLFITTSMHLMIYFFYPKVYLSRMQDQLEKKMDTLQQQIKINHQMHGCCDKKQHKKCI